VQVASPEGTVQIPMKMRLKLWTSIITIAVCLVITIFAVVSHFFLVLRVALAEGQIHTILELKSRALETEDSQVYVEEIRGYYPSGTHQIKGSKLDCIVEMFRSNAIHEIQRCASPGSRPSNPQSSDDKTHKDQ
jgi:hypothetical protein